MPVWCLTTRCIECTSHAIVNGKLDCNYLNRLGLSQPTVKNFLEEAADMSDPTKLEAMIKENEEMQKGLKEEIEKLQKIKQAGEKKDAGMSNV